jgi:hypothetical protein
MTEAQFIAAEQAKQDAALARDLRRIRKSGRASWSKAEAFIAHGLVQGAAQNYTLTEKGMALLVRHE